MLHLQALTPTPRGEGNRLLIGWLLQIRTRSYPINLEVAVLINLTLAILFGVEVVVGLKNGFPEP